MPFSKSERIICPNCNNPDCEHSYIMGRVTLEMIDCFTGCGLKVEKKNGSESFRTGGYGIVHYVVSGVNHYDRLPKNYSEELILDMLQHKLQGIHLPDAWYSILEDGKWVRKYFKA